MINDFFNKESVGIVGNEKNPDTYLYKLKENGLIIHRVFIDAHAKEEKNILLISDVHLSNWNLRDFEEKNPIILETIDKRRSTFIRLRCWSLTQLQSSASKISSLCATNSSKHTKKPASLASDTDKKQNIHILRICIFCRFSFLY